MLVQLLQLQWIRSIAMLLWSVDVQKSFDGTIRSELLLLLLASRPWMQFILLWILMLPSSLVQSICYRKSEDSTKYNPSLPKCISSNAIHSTSQSLHSAFTSTKSQSFQLSILIIYELICKNSQIRFLAFFITLHQINFQLLRIGRVMGFVDSIKGLIYRFDLLATGSLLRIKGDPQHKTIAGGVVSISLMLLLAIVFWNKILSTLDKLMITSSTATKNANDPLPYTLLTTDNNFMFGVQIWNHDLNGPTRYFDIDLSNTNYIYGNVDSSNYYSLQTCTRQHWNGYPQIQAQFDQLHMGRWMCLPKNHSFQVKGKYSSPQSKTVDVTVNKCTNNSYDSRPCASQADIDQFFADNDGVVYYIVYFINPIINPDSQNYLDYYLEDSNYITFSPNGGEESRIFILDYEIQTDQSILPNSDVLVQTGGIVTSNGVKSSYFQVTNNYAGFYFFKSTQSLTYTRSFQKLDNVFSYIGGLFGIILVAFFSIVQYNTFKYQLTLARCLYKKNEEMKPQEKKYNFVNYLGEIVYSFLKFIRISPNWQKFKYYQQMKQQINKQLDILLLLKRINFLQNSLSYLFTEHQIVGLHLANTLTLEQGIRLRRRYRTKYKLKEELQKISKNKGQFHRQQNATLQNIFREDQHFKNMNQNEKNTNIKNQFQQENYSSQSSSSDQDQISILDAVKKIKKQQKDNYISKRIWKNIDKQVALIEKSTNIQMGNQLQQYQFEDITIPQCYRNQQLSPVYQNSVPKIQEFNSEQNGGHKENNVLTKGKFSKLKVIHSELQNPFAKLQQ